MSIAGLIPRRSRASCCRNGRVLIAFCASSRDSRAVRDTPAMCPPHCRQRRRVVESDWEGWNPRLPNGSGRTVGSIKPVRFRPMSRDQFSCGLASARSSRTISSSAKFPAATCACTSRPLQLRFRLFNQFRGSTACSLCFVIVVFGAVELALGLAEVCARFVTTQPSRSTFALPLG